MSSFPQFTRNQDALPEGVFLLPVCTTIDGVTLILAALNYYKRVWPKFAHATMYDVLEALAFVSDPSQSPCSEFAGMRLRQNPDDPCQLQQLQPETGWVTVFDYSLCIHPSLCDMDIINTIQGLLQQLLDMHDGTVGSVAPDLVYDETAADEQRDHVICAALTLAVKLAIEAEISRRNQIFDVFQLASLVIGALAGLLATAITGGLGVSFAIPITLAVAGAITGVAGIGGQILLSTLNDDEFVDTVICCLYDAIKGDTPTMGRIQTAGENCLEEQSEAQHIIFVQWLTEIFSSDEFYISFLDFAQRLWDAPQIATFNCDCIDDTILYEDPMTTGFGSLTHPFSATYPFGDASCPEIGAVWSDTGGRDDPGSAAGQQTCARAGQMKRNVGLVVDLGDEFVVVSSHFWHRQNNSGSHTALIRYRDGSGAIISGTQLTTTGGSTTWRQRVGAENIAGVRYIEMQSETNEGVTNSWIDDIEVMYRPSPF